jgi:putative aldouronate transport system permease protein
MYKHAFRISHEDRRFYRLTFLVVTLFFLIVLYPLIYVVSSSLSSGPAVLAGKVILFPVDFSLEGYKLIMQYKEVFQSFKNTVIYSSVGTVINIVLTMIAAYALARKTLPFRRAIMLMFTFTMFFNGGLIPNYLLIKYLGLNNTMWALILPGCISAYNMILARTYIMSTIPDEMLEAAQIDGCSDIRYFISIVIPFSKAIIAVLCVYYFVGHWNSWFSAFIYLFDREKYPLQLVLREILVANTFDATQNMDPELRAKMQGVADIMKYGLIVISSLPIMVLYPFAQRFFVEGIMIGSVKG